MTVRFGRKKTRQNVIVISKYALEKFVICSINEHPDYLSLPLSDLSIIAETLLPFLYTDYSYMARHRMTWKRQKPMVEKTFGRRQSGEQA